MSEDRSISLTTEAVALGGMKNVRQCRPLVDWAAERVKEGVLLDVGAHFGAFCVTLLWESPGLTCHAFEPNPVAAETLRGMARTNQVEDRLTVHQIALGDQEGTATLCVPDDGKFSGLATLGKPHRFRGGGIVSVEVQTLDRWASEQDLGPIAFLKVDVEGAELLVLQGAESLIRRDHPPLILEYQRENQNQFPEIEKGAVERLLTSWGYEWQKEVRDLLCEWHS